MSEWIKLETRALTDARLMCLSAGAFALWVRGLLHAKQQQSDGDIPAGALRLLAIASTDAKADAAELAACGLWTATDTGWTVGKDNWSRHQKTREEVEAVQKANRERLTKWREGKKVKRDCNAVTADPVTPLQGDVKRYQTQTQTQTQTEDPDTDTDSLPPNRNRKARGRAHARGAGKAPSPDKAPVRDGERYNRVVCFNALAKRWKRVIASPLVDYETTAAKAKAEVCERIAALEPMLAHEPLQEAAVRAAQLAYEADARTRRLVEVLDALWEAGGDVPAAVARMTGDGGREDGHKTRPLARHGQNGGEKVQGRREGEEKESQPVQQTKDGDDE